MDKRVKNWNFWVSEERQLLKLFLIIEIRKLINKNLKSRQGYVKK